MPKHLLRLAPSCIAVALLGLQARTLFAQEPQRARCKLLYPPYVVHEDETQYVADPSGDGAWDLRMFASKAANGGESLEYGKLTVNPGHSIPTHRHLEADEWLYVMSGEGGYAYWAPENSEPMELTITPGSVMFNPQGQLHMVWNTGSEPLVLMVVSKALAPYELLPDWPDRPDGGAGHVPEVQPWEASCAPGHELEEWEQGDWERAAEQEQAEDGDWEQEGQAEGGAWEQGEVGGSAWEQEQAEGEEWEQEQAEGQASDATEEL